ncbi:MAG: hypothetical protein H6656_20515 [Ardenticatenaceae bacterium]|nr:hypothetical protein [Ardenticatenaceae bacterium]
MSKRGRWLLVIGFIGIAICSWLYVWLFHPPIQILEMSIPEKYFPIGADYHPMYSNRDILPALDSGNQTVRWSQLYGLTTFNVERLPTPGLARRVYHLEEDLDIYNLHPYSYYQSSVANDSVIGCGTFRFGGFRCAYTARYREYVTSLNVVVDDEMTIQDFEEIVQYIDNEFQLRLFIDE